jgi:2-polyprenyl-3-methyl-5-hydroxy-6-metoxy-1,4-benzoquinol methylase
MKPTSPIHAANQRRWDAASAKWARGADSRGTWRRCPAEPNLVLSSTELHYLAGIAGKRVCVLGSGDNQVVFALAGLGASVTSVDISLNQLQIAERRSRELNLSIEFLHADVTDLSVIADDSFDAVYTGGHVAIWVGDVFRFYAEAVRILVPMGLFLVCEYHPFRRIWQQSKTSLVVDSHYLNRGPFAYHYGDDILSRAPGSLESHEHRWTIADYLNAAIQAGGRILSVDEFGRNVADWEGAPLGGLPEFLLIVARKDAKQLTTGDAAARP